MDCHTGRVARVSSFSRHLAGAGSVRADREAGEPQRDGHCGPGRRASRHIALVDRITAGAVRRAHTDQPGRELVEVGLADWDGTGIDQPLHDRGAALRCVGLGRAARRRRHAGEVDVVLDRERDAIERQCGRIDVLLSGRVCTQLRQGQAVDPHVMVALCVLDQHPRMQLFDELQRSQPSRHVCLTKGRNRQVESHRMSCELNVQRINTSG